MTGAKLRISKFSDPWKSYTVNEIFDRVGNPVELEEGEEYQEIGIRSHGKGLFYKEKTTAEEIGNKRVFWIEPDCFIVNIVFAWERAVARTNQSEVGMIASHRFPMYKPKKDIVDLDYITQFFTTKRGQNLLILASPGGAGRNKTLGQKEFGETRVKLPSLSEQREISGILKAVDHVIDLAEQDLSLWEEKKKGVMQKIFSQEVRFKAENGEEYPEWEEVPFGSIIKEFKNKTKVHNEDVLLSSAINGMFLNSELFNHERASSNIGYLKIKKGTLILSAQNLHLGNANVNLRFEHGIISPAYKTYEITGCSIEFMAQWIKREETKKFFYDATTVGASQCRRNIEWETLYNQTLLLPCIYEQEKIAECLASIDEVIKMKRQKLETWGRIKKGLLQQMFV